MAIKDKVVNIVLSAKDKASGAFGKLFGSLNKTSEESKKADTALGRFSARLKSLGPSAKVSVNAVKQLGVGIAAMAAAVAASIATLSVFSKSQAGIADDLTNTSNAIGVSREALQIWQIAGKRVGVSGAGVVKTLTSVAERLGKLSATGSGRAGQVFDALNMDIEEFKALAPDEQLIKLAGAFENLPKGEQVGLIRALGTDAEKLMPLLIDNAAGLKAIAEEAANAGAIYSEEELDKLNRANDVYNSINVKLKGLVTRIGAELAPAVGEATDAVLGLFGQVQNSDGFIGIFKRLATGVKEFASNVVENQAAIASGFGTVIDTVQFLGNGLVGVFRGVQAVAAYFLTFVATGIAGVMSVVQGLAFALNKVGVISDSAYNTMAAKAEAARASVLDLQNQTVEFGRQAIDAGAAAANSFNETGEAAKKAGGEVEQVNKKVTKTTEELLAAAEAQKEVIATQLGEMAGQVEAATSQASAAWAAYYASSGEARVQALADLNESISAESLARIEASELAQQLADQQIESERLVAEQSAQKLAAQEEAAEGARQALEKLGVDVTKVMTGISNDAKTAIDGMGDLTREIAQAGLESETAAGAFEQGFTKALEAVNSQKELAELKAKIESLGESGEIGAEEVKAALQSISAKSLETSKDIEASLTAAVGSAKTKEALDALKAQIEGLKDSGEIGAKGAVAALESIRQKALELQVSKVEGNLGLDNVTNSANEAGDGVQKLGEDAQEAGDDIEEGAERGGKAVDFFGSVITSARVAVASLSVAARKLFNQKTGLGDIDLESRSAAESLAKVSEELTAVNDRLILTAAGDWLNRWVREVKVAGLEVQKAFYAQATAVEDLQAGVESGAYSMEELNRISKSAANQFSLLDDQRLSGLQSAIDSARSKIESLNSSAESTLNSLSQRLAEIQGDTEAAQQLQYEAEKKRLVEMQRQAQQEGADNAAADYGKALDQLQKINAIEQRNRAEAENDREKEAADRQRDQERAERERQASDRQRNTTTNNQQSQSSSRQIIVLQSPGGGQTEIQTEDPQALLRILEQAGLRSV
jgi:hypothetical protein